MLLFLGALCLATLHVDPRTRIPIPTALSCCPHDVVASHSLAVVAAVSASIPISLSIPLSSPPVALKTLSLSDQRSVGSSPQMVPCHEVVFVRDQSDRFPVVVKVDFMEGCAARMETVLYCSARDFERRPDSFGDPGGAVGTELEESAGGIVRGTGPFLRALQPLARDFRRDGEVLSCCGHFVPASLGSDSVQFGELVWDRLTAGEELFKGLRECSCIGFASRSINRIMFTRLVG